MSRRHELTPDQDNLKTRIRHYTRNKQKIEHILNFYPADEEVPYFSEDVTIPSFLYNRNEVTSLITHTDLSFRLSAIEAGIETDVERWFRSVTHPAKITEPHHDL